MEVKEGAGWTPSGDLAKAFQRIPGGLILLNVFDPRGTLPTLLAGLPGQLQTGINAAIVQARMKATSTAQAAAAPPSAVAGRLRPGMNADRRGRDERFPRELMRRRFDDDEDSPGPLGRDGRGFGAPFPGTAGGLNSITEGLIQFDVDPAKLPKPDELKTGLFPGTLAVSVDDQGVTITRRAALPNLVIPLAAAGIAVALPEIQKAQGTASPAGQATTPATAAAQNPNIPRPGTPPVIRRRRRDD
jgi:hypothetical protein